MPEPTEYIDPGELVEILEDAEWSSLAPGSATLKDVYRLLSVAFRRGGVTSRAEMSRLSLENDRLRNQCATLEKVRDERDACAQDLSRVGELVGCNHFSNGIARCVREVIESLREENAGLRKMVTGLADRVAAQSELLGKRAEVKRLWVFGRLAGWLRRKS